jgi:hypothetical protein
MGTRHLSVERLRVSSLVRRAIAISPAKISAAVDDPRFCLSCFREADLRGLLCTARTSHSVADRPDFWGCNSLARSDRT